MQGNGALTSVRDEPITIYSPTEETELELPNIPRILYFKYDRENDDIWASF